MGVHVTIIAHRCVAGNLPEASNVAAEATEIVGPSQLAKLPA